MKSKYRYISAAAFLIAIAVFGVLAGRSSMLSTPVRAADIATRGGATAEMLAFALNLDHASDFELVGSNGFRNGNGTSFATNSIDPQVRADLVKAYGAIEQLPCEIVDQSALADRTFGPGVYCLDHGELAGLMTVDAAGETNARFVFRIAGTMTVSNDVSIKLANGAISSNVYFVAGDTLSIGKRGDINANLISLGDISVDSGSNVHGRVLSVKGSVNITDAVVAAGTGYIEVCKQVVAGDVIPDGTLFTFNVAGIDHQAPVGGCTSPILVTAGNVTVVEALRDNTAVVDITARPASRLVSANRAIRTAVVAVPEGEANNQTVVTFTNQTTATGVIEICKFGSDSDVTGYFQFTAQGAPGQTFAVPVGYCSLGITLTIPQSGANPPTANVTELARENYRLTDAGTFPTSSFISLTPNAGFGPNGDALPNNTDGGYATVTLATGGPGTMVVVAFYNRSLPGAIKVCKITADEANIPINTAFTFQVTGMIPSSPTQIMPGIADTTTVQVRAGSVAQNGFCAFVPDRSYIVGTPVVVTEIGAAAPINFAEVRVSRIRGLTGLVSTSLINKTATLMARNNTAEVEFTNFVFRPAVLKICKLGATPDVTGSFSFTMAAADPLTTWNVSSSPLTVPVGACTFLQGPFDPVPGLPGIGTFNQGTQLNVTEAADGTTILQDVSSSTASPISFTTGSRTGTITLNQAANAGSLNEIIFTNAAAPATQSAARFDFDG
ncbi:MAG: ice-binding family protein, partial [Acidobacteriota bacterium]